MGLSHCVCLCPDLFLKTRVLSRPTLVTAHYLDPSAKAPSSNSAKCPEVLGVRTSRDEPITEPQRDREQRQAGDRVRNTG